MYISDSGLSSHRNAFREAHWHSRFTRETGAAACGVSVKTYQRWLSGNRPAPAYAFRIVRAVGQGDLSEISPRWENWVINSRGELCSPSALVFQPGELEATQYLKVVIEELRRKIRELEQQHPVVQLPGADSGLAERTTAWCKAAAASRNRFSPPSPPQGGRGLQGGVGGQNSTCEAPRQPGHGSTAVEVASGFAALRPTEAPSALPSDEQGAATRRLAPLARSRRSPTVPPMATTDRNRKEKSHD